MKYLAGDVISSVSYALPVVRKKEEIEARRPESLLPAACFTPSRAGLLGVLGIYLVGSYILMLHVSCTLIAFIPPTHLVDIYLSSRSSGNC